MTSLIIDELKLGLNECFSDEDVLPYLKSNESAITVRDFLIRASLGNNWELVIELNFN